MQELGKSQVNSSSISSGFQLQEIWRLQCKIIVHCSLRVWMASRVLLFQYLKLSPAPSLIPSQYGVNFATHVHISVILLHSSANYTLVLCHSCLQAPLSLSNVRTWVHSLHMHFIHYILLSGCQGSFTCTSKRLVVLCGLTQPWLQVRHIPSPTSHWCHGCMVFAG